MPRKYSVEEIIYKIREKHKDSIDVEKDTLIDCQTKATFICKICGNKWKARPYSIIAGHGCRKCYDKRNSENKKMSLCNIANILKETNQNIIITGEYIDTKHYTTFKCLKCGNEWETMPYIVLGGHGCPKCNSAWSNRRKTREEFISEMNKLYNNKYIYIIDKEYVLTRDIIKFICPKHGMISQLSYTHAQGNGCKHCKESSLEKEIKFMLENNNINYIPQFNAEWLGKQTLDFYIPDIKTAIECQGRQHFEPIDIFGGEDCLSLCIERDERKRLLCKENNIELIYFLNKEYNKYIDDSNIKFNNVYNIIEYINNKVVYMNKK